MSQAISKPLRAHRLGPPAQKQREMFWLDSARMRGGRRDWSQVLRGDEIGGGGGGRISQSIILSVELEFYLYLKYNEKFAEFEQHSSVI